MEQVEIAKLSSKGQLVLPQEVRKKLHLEEGEKFFVFCGNDTVILKKIERPAKERFRALLKESRAYAKRVGLTPSHIEEAIRRVRQKSK